MRRSRARRFSCQCLSASKRIVRGTVWEGGQRDMGESRGVDTLTSILENARAS